MSGKFLIPACFTPRPHGHTSKLDQIESDAGLYRRVPVKKIIRPMSLTQVSQHTARTVKFPLRIGIIATRNGVTRVVRSDA